MPLWILRAATLGVLAIAALIGAAAGVPAGVVTAGNSAPNGFSGPLGSGIVAKPIDRVVAPAASAALHRVPCAVASAGSTCFAPGSYP